MAFYTIEGGGSSKRLAQKCGGQRHSVTRLPNSFADKTLMDDAAGDAG